MDNTAASLRLTEIAQAEGIDINKPVLDALISTSSGDLRRAITYLQSASRLSTSSVPHMPILPADIQEIAGVVPDAVINDFAQALGIEVEDLMDVDDEPKKRKPGFDLIRKKVTMLMKEGYSASQIVSQVRQILSFNFLDLHRSPPLVARRGRISPYVERASKIRLRANLRGGR